ncbi:putative leucine-rich repeat domain, L domain-containing protein [Rosa chinensis]|uniref:Putative leucine-rich repeat domain, L domain-containing protein n=1 Tax=Rosa chinensis TaxID=74649 RepID=A0A2P6PKE4_ROSCH|nr:putative leucine-rich repeat domain, L domain-containing protein [Rosa chinensis]
MMNRLRYLVIENGNLLNGLDYLPNSLRILKWTGYPLKSLPADFSPETLLELNMCHSCIEHFPLEIEPLYNLKTLKLCNSLNLVNTPNFKGMPHLELLFLEGCTRLCEVDPGVEVLEKLTILNLKDCKNLVHFASNLCGLKSLKVLNLSGCSKLKKLPNDMGHLESLVDFDASGTSIRELPCSSGMLEGLVSMSLRDCKHLVFLPSSVGGLKSLKYLNLSGCSKLDKLPDELGLVAYLEKLDVSGSGIREVPSFIGLLKNLKKLCLGGCKGQSPKSWNMMFNPFQLFRKRSHVPAGLSLASLSGLHSLTKLNLSDCNLSEIPSDFGCLSLLRDLDLSKNQFVRLPESIGQLSRLEFIHLNWCRKLQTLPELPTRSWVNVSNCISLDTLSNQIGKLMGVNCLKMVENESCKSTALSLLTRYLKFQHWTSPGCTGCFNFVAPGDEIPEWYNHQSVGSLITVELHPGWFTNKWMGFTFCVVFGPLNPPPPSGHGFVGCYLTANGESLGDVWLTFGEKWGQAVLDHIWFFYPHRNDYLMRDHAWQDIYYQLEFSFKLDWGQVKKCGLRMVYEEDVDVLWQTLLKQSNTKRGLQHDYDEDAACSSTATGASQEEEEEPYPKRFKRPGLDGAGPSDQKHG